MWIFETTGSSGWPAEMGSSWLLSSFLGSETSWSCLISTFEIMLWEGLFSFSDTVFPALSLGGYKQPSRYLTRLWCGKFQPSTTHTKPTLALTKGSCKRYSTTLSSKTTPLCLLKDTPCTSATHQCGCSTSWLLTTLPQRISRSQLSV